MSLGPFLFLLWYSTGGQTTYHLKGVVFLPPDFHLPDVAILILVRVSEFLDKFDGRASGASKWREFGAWNLGKRLWRIGERC